MSKKSWFPYWSHHFYTYVASPLYDQVTRLTRWQQHLHSVSLDGLPPKGSLLDVGCGTGLVVELAHLKGYEVCGVDASIGMLEQAKKLRKIESQHWVCALSHSLPFKDENFDIIFSSGALVHIPKINETVNEMIRVLKPGGIIRILDHAPVVEKSAFTPIAKVFSHLSGDIIHDYKKLFSNLSCVQHKTIGRGGILQLFDFLKEN